MVKPCSLRRSYQAGLELLCTCHSSADAAARQPSSGQAYVLCTALSTPPRAVLGSSIPIRVPSTRSLPSPLPPAPSASPRRRICPSVAGAKTPTFPACHDEIRARDMRARTPLQEFIRAARSAKFIHEFRSARTRAHAPLQSYQCARSHRR